MPVFLTVFSTLCIGCCLLFFACLVCVLQSAIISIDKASQDKAELAHEASIQDAVYLDLQIFLPHSFEMVAVLIWLQCLLPLVRRHL